MLSLHMMYYNNLPDWTELKIIWGQNVCSAGRRNRRSLVKVHEDKWDSMCVCMYTCMHTCECMFVCTLASKCECVCARMCVPHRRRAGRGRGALGSNPCRLDADGRIGMVNQAQQREEGFFTQAVVCGSGDRKRQGSVPAVQFPCYLSHCFFPRPTVQLGQHSTKGLAHSQAPQPGL